MTGVDAQAIRAPTCTNHHAGGSLAVKHGRKSSHEYRVFAPQLCVLVHSYSHQTRTYSLIRVAILVAMFEIEVPLAKNQTQNTQQAPLSLSLSFLPDTDGASNRVRSCVWQKGGWQQRQACWHRREACSRQQQASNTHHRERDVELGGGYWCRSHNKEQRTTKEKMLRRKTAVLTPLTDRYKD